MVIENHYQVAQLVETAAHRGEEARHRRRYVVGVRGVVAERVVTSVREDLHGREHHASLDAREGSSEYQESHDHDTAYSRRSWVGRHC